MKHYECCRCGTIFPQTIDDVKKEILCPDCGSGAKEVEDIVKDFKITIDGVDYRGGLNLGEGKDW